MTRTDTGQTTQTSAAVTLVVTAAGLALVLGQFPDLAVPATVGAGGAICLAVSLWLVSGTETPQSAFAASLLSVPTAVGFVGGAYTAGLTLAETLLPVEESALLSVGVLVIFAHAGIVIGVAVATLGVVSGRWNVIRGEPLRRYTRVVFAAGSVVGGSGLLFVVVAGLAGAPPGAALVAVASTVPGIGLLAVAVGLFGYGLWLLARGQRIADRLAPPVRGAIVGGVLTTGLAAVAGPVLYTGLVEETVQRFPTEVAVQIRDATLGPTEQLGEAAVFLLLLVFLLGITAWVLFLLRFVLSRGHLSYRAPGPSLASVGLFTATAFAGIVGAPRWLVVAGVAASLVVWDAGQFGATLVREIGHSESTRGPELVHASATVLVGGVGLLATLAVGSLLSGVSGESASVLSLWSVVVGLVLLTVAMR